MFSDFTDHLGLCIWKNVTGLPCPGCGMTRALFALLQLDFPKAFSFHPLFWLVPFFLLVFLLRNRVSLCNKISRNSYIIWGAIGLFFLVYGYRMFQSFPLNVPMDYNRYALIPSIWRMLTM